jgi:Ca2+-binding EF-hand superfamily protein
MNTTRYTTALLALTAALTGCSRQSPEPPPPSEVATMRPAAGPPMSGSRRSSHCFANFDGFDADADGRVSRDEFMSRPHAARDPEAVFRARDQNADGSLTSPEFCTGYRRGASDMGPAAGHPMRRGGARDFAGGARCEQHFDAFDADRDDKLTREEFGAWPHVHGDAEMLFGERDLDRDGSVTRDEFCTRWRGTASP